MPEPTAFADLAARAERDLIAASTTLLAAGVEPEDLAELIPAHRRLLIFSRPAVMRPLGRVWRLGVLLLSADPYRAGPGGSGTDLTVGPLLFATGRATRAAERGRPNHQSVSREERRDIAAAALRGGYPAGSPVHFAVTPIPLVAEHLAELAEFPRPDLPVGVAGGELRVRWRSGAPLDPAPTLRQYVRERMDLLLDPPLSST